jgi:hypothetical protein
MKIITTRRKGGWRRDGIAKEYTFCYYDEIGCHELVLNEKEFAEIKEQINNI